MQTEYSAFLHAKMVQSPDAGLLEVARDDLHPALFDFQKDAVLWALRGGRRALFEAFGMGKTRQQLEILRLIVQREGGKALIVMPLGVRQEFRLEAEALGVEISYVRDDAEASAAGPLIMTNYERVRDGQISPAFLRSLTAVSLDEAAVLRGFGGTKTFREFMRLLAGDGGRGPKGTGKTKDGIPFRFVATATPSPNDFIELLAYAAYLGIMDVSEAKTRWFKRDSTRADRLTLHEHKEQEFWGWVASWALFVTRPSDLGYPDEGYDLPPLDVRWHEIPSDHSDAGEERYGQGRLLRNAALGVVDASREKRESLPGRIAKLMEIRAEEPDAHRIIWHDLEAERRAIEEAVPDAVTVYGSQELDAREASVIDFANGRIREIASKPVLLGAGVNFQRHCSRAVFLGIGFKFNDFVQAIHRVQRFGQKHPVRIDLIYTEAERDVRATLERKWRQHEKLVGMMTGIVRQYGLAKMATAGAKARVMGAERVVAEGKNWRLVNNDSVLEAMDAPADSAALILTSVPFSTQYEYTPSYNDFGHTDDVPHFFRQMDFLTPELLRVLQPGRILAVHVKDRIVPGGLTGLGFQTVQPFHADCIYHYQRHGFAYLGMKTIVTDVVRENNQTYRLGWTEQCKDGSRMGVGMPEYLLLFRKPPTDSGDGYADVPVVKSKAEYSRGRWQLDAHGFERSSGNRLLSPEDFDGISHDTMYKLWRRFSSGTVYDFEHHVRMCESLENRGRLPVTFMLLPPHSWHPDVWTDVTRMRTLNGAQHAKGKEMHLCPLQFDIVDRAIVQYTMPGELVLDPFAGLGTVPLRAVELGRRGEGWELSRSYWTDAVAYLRAAEATQAAPTLFDLVDAEASGPEVAA
jgi:hypothetical protein